MTAPISQTIPFHNPDNLTAEQVGEGWRLLVKEEIGLDAREYPSYLHDKCSGWVNGVWDFERFGCGNKSDITYRTREPLPEKYWRRFQTNIAKVWIWDGIRGYWDDGQPSEFDIAYAEERAANPDFYGWKELPAQVPDDDKEPDWFSDSYQRSLRLKWAENPGIEREQWLVNAKVWEPVCVLRDVWHAKHIYRERIKPPEPKRVFLTDQKLEVVWVGSGCIGFNQPDGDPASVLFLSKEDLGIINRFAEAK